MSDNNRDLVVELIRLFAHALQAKAQRRTSIFDGLVAKRFDALRGVHQALHGQLRPADQKLARIEEVVASQGNTLAAELADLADQLHAIHDMRGAGKSERRELYEYCLVFARSGMSLKGYPKALSDDERGLITQFMNLVCAYFETNGRYEHEFGTTLAALMGLVENWRSGHLSLGKEDVAEVRLKLGNCLDKMEQAWAKTASQFARIEAALVHNLDAPKHLASPVHEATRQRAA